MYIAYSYVTNQSHNMMYIPVYVYSNYGCDDDDGGTIATMYVSSAQP